MVPEPSRRAVLSAVAAAGAAGVAGCTGVSGGDGDSGEQTTNGSPPTTKTTSAEPTQGSPDTTEPTTTEETVDDPVVAPATSPVAAVESAFTTADAAVFQSRFHPLHPYSLDRLPEGDAQNLVDNTVEPTDIERVDREVTADLVMAAPLPDADVERSAVEDALTDANAAVVAATAADGEDSQTVQLATVEYDGGWLILAHPLPSTDEAGASTLDARVVSDVAFEPDRHAARVQFVSAAVADSVTVEAVQSGDSVTADAPGDESLLEVDLDPDGDEVVVRATVDGESRVVHRERYPESDRLVDDVEFVADPEGDSRDAIARVTFTYSNEETGEEDGRVRVVSTVQGGEAEAEPVGSLRYLNVGVDPEGDEVVVTYPVGGDTEEEEEEIHRERVYPQ